ncbi:conserved hypothetical protein [Mycobacterium tuberculosis]|nr:conserved hypothetical protein [Mycobacterium tuberculosis]
MGWLSLESGRIAAVHVGAWEGYSWLAFGTTNGMLPSITDSAPPTAASITAPKSCRPSWRISSRGATFDRTR